MKINTFCSEIKNFISSHKTLCVVTLGLAVIGYCIGKLGERCVVQLKKCSGAAKKTDSAGQTVIRQASNPNNSTTVSPLDTFKTNKGTLDPIQDHLAVQNGEKESDLTEKESELTKKLVHSLKLNDTDTFFKLFPNCYSVNPSTSEGMVILMFAISHTNPKILDDVRTKIEFNEANAPLLEVIKNFGRNRQTENPSPFDNSHCLNTFIEKIIHYQPTQEYSDAVSKFKEEIIQNFVRTWHARVPVEQQESTKVFLNLFNHDKYTLEIQASLPDTPRFPWELARIESLEIKSSSAIELPLEFSRLPKLKRLFLKEANNCIIHALPSNLLELTVSNAYSDLGKIPPVKLLKVVYTEILSNQHVQKLCQVHPDTEIALELNQSQQIPSEIDRIGEKIIDILIVDNSSEPYIYPSQIRSLVKVDTLKRMHIHNQTLNLLIQQLLINTRHIICHKIRNINEYREKFYYYLDLYEKSPEEFKKLISQEFTHEPQFLINQLGEKFANQKVDHFTPDEVIGFMKSLLEAYPEWQGKISGRFEEIARLYLYILPYWKNWSETLFNNLTHLREWIKAPESYENRKIPKEADQLNYGQVPCHRKYTENEVKRELTLAFVKEFKQQQEAGAVKLKIEKGVSYSVKGYYRMNIVFSLPPDLYHKFFQAYQLSYATHPKKGEEWQHHVLQAAVETFMSIDVIKLLNEEEQHQVRKAFLEGKIWVNEDDWAERNFEKIDIKTAWYQKNQEKFPLVEYKLDRDMQIWRIGFS